MRTARQIIDNAQVLVNDMREHPTVVDSYREELQNLETEIFRLHAEVMAEVRERGLKTYNPHHL